MFPEWIVTLLLTVASVWITLVIAFVVIFALIKLFLGFGRNKVL
jgi:hypothetical protein